MVSSLTADNGALGNLIAEGNAQAMCQFVGSITSLLNSKAEPEPVVIPPTTEPPDVPAPQLSPKELAALKAKQSVFLLMAKLKRDYPNWTSRSTV